MAVNIGELVAELTLDDRDFEAGVRGFKRHVAEFERGSRKLGQELKDVAKFGGIAAAALGAVGAGFAKSVIDAARTSENLRLRLDALLGSTQEGARAFKLMSDFAATVPFELEEIMSSATQLAGIVTGGADEIAGLMPIIADLAAVSGLSIQQTTEQIVRAFSAGIGSADLFRERGITAMLGFQAGATVSAQETRDQIIAAWNDAGSKFRGASERMAGTWDGIVSMLSDRWFQFRNLVAESGLFDAAKEMLEDLLDHVDTAMKTIAPILQSNSENIKQAMEQLGIIAGVSFGEGIIRAILALQDKMREILPPVFEQIADFMAKIFGGAFAEMLADQAAKARDTALKELEGIAEQARILVGRREREAGAVAPGLDPNVLHDPMFRAGLMDVPARLQGDELQKLLDHAGDGLNKMAKAAEDVTGTFKSSFGNAVSSVIFQLQSFADALRSVIQTVLQTAIETGIGALLPFQHGGIVPTTGPIFAHAGEMVVPAHVMRSGFNLSLNVAGMPAARNPLADARDREWLRFLSESNFNLEHQGFRFRNG